MKKILVIVFSFAVALSSCKKELDISPTDEIDANKAFQTVSDLQSGLYAVYAADAIPYDGNIEYRIKNKVYIGSILADECKISNENRGQGQGQFKWQYSSTEGEHNQDYYTYYNMIDQDNRILQIMDDIPANNASEESIKTRIKAELLALRGIAHYELLIRFMPDGYDPNALGVPIMLQSSVTGQPARNTVGEVVAQIQTDLTAGRAESLIPNAPDDVFRLSQSAIAAYQARVALLTKDWASAASFATEAMTLSGKTLATGQEFKDYWFDYNESETIWKYSNANPQLYWQDSNGDVFFEPSDKLKSTFNRSNDIRFSTFFTISSRNADTALISKYPGSDDGPQINDLKLIRVAEMYLIRAEAEAENNQLTEASNDINILRAARITGYTNVTFTGQDEAVAAIMQERFKELCYEGFRFFDLKRKGLPVERLASDVQSSVWQTLSADDYHFALPIPAHEVLANQNIVQNTGY